LAITVFYLTISLILGGFIDPLSESSFRQVFENILTFLALIFFGVGFSSGDYIKAYSALGVIFLITWLSFLIFTYGYYLIKILLNKKYSFNTYQITCEAI
jgi:predicted Na+-dependent transporter